MSIPKLTELVEFLNTTQAYGTVDMLDERIESILSGHEVIRQFTKQDKGLKPDETFMVGAFLYFATRFVIPKAMITDDETAKSSVECNTVKLPEAKGQTHDTLESFNAAFQKAKKSNYAIIRFDNRRGLKIGFVCLCGDGCTYHSADFRTVSYIWSGLNSDGTPKKEQGPWSIPEIPNRKSKAKADKKE